MIKVLFSFFSFNTQVFLVMTKSVVGGLPLGVVLTTNLEEHSLEKGFNLLKDILSDEGFYGLKKPAVIMTDDCTAERNALQVH